MPLTLLKIAVLLPWTIMLSTIALLSIPQASGDAFRWTARTWSRSILSMFRIRVHVAGAEHLRPEEHYVFVSNHASMFDIPACLSALPPDVNIVFKKELTRVPVWGWALRYGHFIMIDRSNARDAMQSLERAAATIRAGTSVLLFAEGTRTLDGRLQPFKRGAFSLAVKSGRPVVPVTINHTYRILPKGSINVRATDIELVIGEPIPTAGLDGKAGEQLLMERVQAAIAARYQDQSEGAADAGFRA